MSLWFNSNQIQSCTELILSIRANLIGKANSCDVQSNPVQSLFFWSKAYHWNSIKIKIIFLEPIQFETHIVKLIASLGHWLITTYFWAIGLHFTGITYISLTQIKPKQMSSNPNQTYTKLITNNPNKSNGKSVWIGLRSRFGLFTATRNATGTEFAHVRGRSDFAWWYYIGTGRCAGTTL